MNDKLYLGASKAKMNEVVSDIIQELKLDDEVNALDVMNEVVDKHLIDIDDLLNFINKSSTFKNILAKHLAKNNNICKHLFKEDKKNEYY